METVVILMLTVAVAATVVWWVTFGELPFSFLSGRREDTGTAGGPQGASENEGLGGASGFASATTRRPRTHPAPTRKRRHEAGRVVDHSSSQSPFTYATPLEDRRPPIVLTLLRLIFTVALVGGLIAGSIWLLGQFATSFMARLIGE